MLGVIRVTAEPFSSRCGGTCGGRVSRAIRVMRVIRVIRVIKVIRFIALL